MNTEADIDASLIKDPIRYLEDNYSIDACKKFLKYSLKHNELSLFKYCLTRIAVATDTMMYILEHDLIEYLEHIHYYNLVSTFSAYINLYTVFTVKYNSNNCLKYYMKHFPRETLNVLDIIVPMINSDHKDIVLSIIQFSMDQKIDIDLEHLLGIINKVQ